MNALANAAKCLVASTTTSKQRPSGTGTYSALVEYLLVSTTFSIEHLSGTFLLSILLPLHVFWYIKTRVTVDLFVTFKEECLIKSYRWLFTHLGVVSHPSASSMPPVTDWYIMPQRTVPWVSTKSTINLHEKFLDFILGKYLKQSSIISRNYIHTQLGA
jgi:hypothetical protein